jgi:hypothetical protein
MLIAIGENVQIDGAGRKPLLRTVSTEAVFQLLKIGKDSGEALVRLSHHNKIKEIIARETQRLTFVYR